MGFMNKLNNVLDNHRSNKDEKNEIVQMNDDKAAEQKAIDEQLMAIGQYYWNRYANDTSYVPDEDIKGAFIDIETRVVRIKELEKQIEERKAAGEEERRKIDEDTAAREAEMKRAKEEAARIKAEQKEAKKAAKLLDDEDQQ